LNILVTGGSGFIGLHLLKELAKSRHRVAVISKREIPELSSIKTILGNFNTLDKMHKKLIDFNPEIIIHLSWQGIPDFSSNMCQKNLSDSINFFDWIFENMECKKIIMSGSCFEYGKKQGACSESDSVSIDSYFTWAKYSLNQYLSIRCAEMDIILNWFRIFYVYGPGQREESLIPLLIKSICAKETPRIKTPMNKNDFIYVEDVARAFAIAVDADLPSGVYNLGSGTSTSVYDICKIVEKQFIGNGLISEQVLENGQSTETVNFWADMEKTERALIISCDTSLEEGIEQQIQSMKYDVITHSFLV
jgi:UDP-glucose 4-epimerase